MKKVINFSLLIVALITATSGYSKDLVSSINKEKKENTIIEFKQVQKGSLLLIKDANEFTLYEETMKENGAFSRIFDFSHLPNGEYYFELNSKNEIKIIPFTVINSVTGFVQEAEYSISKPKIIVENNYVHISTQSSEKQNMELKVYYDGDDLAYKESLDNAKTINRTYDFSNSLSGRYTIILTSDGRSFIDNIKIP